MHMPGKRGRKVPLILAPEWTKAMELLVKSRSSCHVSSQYFFGKPYSNTYIQPWKVVFNFHTGYDFVFSDFSGFFSGL